jgi:DNA-binding transcriptional LysR family regulator
MTRSPDLDSLRLLTLVDGLGSLGAAAAELGIAQPSASKRLATLERRLGLVLVDRTRHGSRLTPEGQAVAGWAQRVLTELAGLTAGAEALRARHDAELRVAASLTVAEYLAPGWIADLRQRRPDLYVGLRVTNSEHVAELVRSEAAEVGFVESPAAPRGCATRRVAADRLIVVVAPAHPWARRRTTLTVIELAATPLLVREEGSGTRDTLDRALSAAGAQPAHPLAELGSTSAVLAAVMSGAGPAVISELAARTGLADGRLVMVELPGLELLRTLRAVWPAGRKLAGAAAELVAIAGR